MNLNLITPLTNPNINKDQLWDLVIVGSGPAGYNAGLYARRKGLDVLIITKELGGQLKNTEFIDNYLGISRISGDDLDKKFYNHLKDLDVNFITNQLVTSINKINNDFYLRLENGQTIKSRTVLISTGGSPRKLNVPGELEYANKGVSYCAICDAPFFKDKHVIIAGGGNSAITALIDLAKWASKITIVQRSVFRADQILLDQLKNVKDLSIHLHTDIIKITGEEKMTGIDVYDKTNNKYFNIKADGIFIEIGSIPNSYLVKDIVSLDEHNQIIVDENQMTSLEGLFAAGDVTNEPYKQIIIAASDGAKAALAINAYINKLKIEEK